MFIYSPYMWLNCLISMPLDYQLLDLSQTKEYFIVQLQLIQMEASTTSRSEIEPNDCSFLNERLRLSFTVTLS